MKIMVQALGIHTGGGPANHLRGFLKALSRYGTAHEWMFVLNDALALEVPVPSNVMIRTVRIKNPAWRLYEDLVEQRIAVRRFGTDALINLADFGPLPSKIPVLSFQRNPNYYDRDLLALRHGLDRAEWEFRRRMAYRVVRHSNRVLCPSETMADAVRHSVDVPAERVGSLYHPYEGPSARTSWSPATPRRILYTGHLMPHKNHRWLLDAFIESGLAMESVELWMTASRGIGQPAMTPLWKWRRAPG